MHWNKCSSNVLNMVIAEVEISAFLAAKSAVKNCAILISYRLQLDRVLQFAGIVKICTFMERNDIFALFVMVVDCGKKPTQKE